MTGSDASAQGARHSCRFATLSVSLSLFTAACASDEPWSFPLSQSFYGTVDMSSASSYGADPYVAAAVLALPLAIDLLILPITLPHDLFEHGIPW